MNYWIGLTLVGIISGLWGGMIGAGAEILVVPLLTIFGILKSLKMRIGTSLVMLLPPIGLFSVYQFYKTKNIDLYGGLYMALIFTLCAAISSKYTLKMNINLLRKIFGFFTIISGIYILFTKESIN